MKVVRQVVTGRGAHRRARAAAVFGAPTGHEGADPLITQIG
jgi:hypothetical protein